MEVLKKTKVESDTLIFIYPLDLAKEGEGGERGWVWEIKKKTN